MGIVRVALIVFSIASILVLAGFSTILNEKAFAQTLPLLGPPFGDFKCWEFVPGTGIVVPPALLEITDQFGSIGNEIWEQAAYCTAASKLFDTELFESPFFFTEPVPFAQHYQGWFYPTIPEPTIGPGTGQTVIIDVPQFNQNFQTTLLNLDSILVPATKFLESGGNNNLIQNFVVVESADTQQHWNCYLIEEQPPLDASVPILTQHGEQFVQVLDPFLFCAPMIKFDPFSEQTFGQLLDEHMICYDLLIIPDGITFNLPIALEDQLSSEPLPVTLGLEELLCVPAFKSFPAIGGTMIPIDTTTLLLAGVQSISMWMIPVVAAGVAIGIFVIKRRK